MTEDTSEFEEGEEFRESVVHGAAGIAKPEELRTALDFLKIQEGNYGKPNDVRAWQDLCHVLFNVKEFVFIP